jgi:small-conductance mechanosensitive channel
MLRSLVSLLVLCLVPVLALANPQRGLPDVPPDLDRSSPAKVIEAFVAATDAGDFDRAAYLLDLRRIAKDEQALVAAERARQLRYVLDRLLPLDAYHPSSETSGNPQDGAGKDVVGELRHEELVVPVELHLVPDGTGGAVWLFSANAVRAAPTLYERIGPGWLGSFAPAWSFRMSVLGLAVWQVMALSVIVVAAFALAWLLTRALLALGRRIARQTDNHWDNAVVNRLQSPCTLLLTVMVTDLSLPLVKLTNAAEMRVSRVTQFLAILATTWIVVRVVQAVSVVALAKVEDDTTPGQDLIRHGKRSRIALTTRIAIGGVYFVGLSLGLMQFESVRQIGVSLLASAGVVGVVVGIAAQKSVANLLAGLQISWAQPFRLGDQVRVLDDVGWIEEITFTYVSVKTWDGRRRIFPITYFTENQFENWSRTDKTKLAVVLFHVDYSTPIEPLRQQVREWLETDPAWDRNAFGLVVIDVNESTVVLRFIASVPDASRGFELSTRMRERMVGYLQTHEDGKYMPRRRVNAVGTDEPDATPTLLES